MIRLIQRRLIIPRGDTGSFSLPVLANKNIGDVAVFTIFDSLTKTRAFQKIIEVEGDVLTIAFSHNETVNLKPGKYFWDIKFYSNPQIIDDELVNGDEVDSYYAGFTMPACEIRETADNYLVSPDSPTATLSSEQLDIIMMNKLDWNLERYKTRDRLLEYDFNIYPIMPHSAGLSMIYPWENITIKQLEKQFIEIVKSNGYTGSEDELWEKFSHGSIQQGTLNTFPIPGNIENIYFDNEKATLYYYQFVEGEIDTTSSKFAGARIFIDEDSNTHLYIPIKARCFK